MVGYGLYISTGDGVVGYVAIYLYWGVVVENRAKSLQGTEW